MDVCGFVFENLSMGEIKGCYTLLSIWGSPQIKGS